MEKVYRRKWLISIIMLISLSIFNLLCSLMNSPKEEGYLSFSFPKILEATNCSRVVLTDTVNENPDSYTVMLMIGKDNTYTGKIVEKKYLPGDNVVIKGLTPGKLYSIIITAESKTNSYENISDKIFAKEGRKTNNVNFVSKNKSKVKLELPSINLINIIV